MIALGFGNQIYQKWLNALPKMPASAAFEGSFHVLMTLFQHEGKSFPHYFIVYQPQTF